VLKREKESMTLSNDADISSRLNDLVVPNLRQLKPAARVLAERTERERSHARWVSRVRELHYRA